MSSEIDSLIETVQQNCHISDARFAQNYTLCIYLLKMRELYRWEQGHGYEEKLAHEALGGWITEREALWDRVENDAFSDLSFASQLFSPFESDMLNNKLFPHGYVYSGGYGRFAKPLFVVAELESQQQHQAMNIVITGRELARDIVAPPAMTQGKTIIVRRESLQRMLWERIEEWGWKEYENSMGRALSSYSFKDSPAEILEEMTNNEIEAVVLHEIGEYQCGERLNPLWNEMVMSIAGTKSELYARAIRDHIADAISTLPQLIATQNTPSIHFYMANFSGIRREIFPALLDVYKQWCSSDNGSLTPVKTCIDRGLEHWVSIANEMVNIYNNSSEYERIDRLEAMINLAKLET